MRSARSMRSSSSSASKTEAAARGIWRTLISCSAPKTSAPTRQESAAILVERALIARRLPLNAAIGLMLLSCSLRITEQLVEFGDRDRKLGAGDGTAFNDGAQHLKIGVGFRDDLSVEEGALIV